MKTQYLTLDALSSVLGLPRTYLRRLAKLGDLPYLNVGGKMRFSEAQVREKLEAMALEVEKNDACVVKNRRLAQGT